MTAGGRVSGVLERILGTQDLEWRRGRGIALRTLFLIACAIALFTVCRNGQSTVVVGVAFALYVAATALWVRGQYATSLTARLWTPPLLTSALVTLFFVGCLVAGVHWNNGSLFITGLVAGFYALGYLAMGLRTTSERRSPRFWVLSLAVLTLTTGAGVALLGTDTPLRWWLLLPALVLPIPLSVLSDRLITALNGDRARHPQTWAWSGTWLALAGAAVALAGTVAALARVRGPWMTVALVVLALLVLALVSSTYADIAIIVAIIAVLGITPQQQASPPEPDASKTQVLVALGDSYMSGEGASVYYAGTDNDGNHCRRAPTAWAELAAQRLDFDGFISFACSGARTYNVNSEQAEGGPPPRPQFASIGTQLDDYATKHEQLGFTPKLVVVSLGGNDAGFATIGAMCLAPGDCGTKGRKLWIPNLPIIERQLRATYEQISAAFEDVPVAVVGYPDPIYDPQGLPAGDPDRQDCGRVPLSADDRDFIEELLTGLNSAVRDAARDAGFYYVEAIESSLANARLQLCDPANDNRPGLNIIGLQSVTGVAEDRFNPKNWYHNSLHPNERGHAALLAGFESWLDAHPDLFDGDPRAGAATPVEDAPEPEVPDALCRAYDVGDDDSTSCETAGYNWIGSEVSHALIPWWGLIYLLVAGGAWMLAVCFFAWRERVATRELRADLEEIAALEVTPGRPPPGSPDD